MRVSFIAGLAVGALGLAACGSDTSGTFGDDEGTAGEYNIDAETDEISSTIKTEDGTTTLRSGADVPVELPEGFSIFPGGQVIQNTRIEQAEGLVVGVTIEVEETAAKVAEFYTAQAKAAGYAIEMNMTSGQTVMIAGSNEAGAQFTLNATEAGGATTAMLNTAQGME